jgi:hypothetical protein
VVCLLPVQTITTAVTGVTPGSVFQFRKGSPRNLSVQATFAYGASGGTTVTVYVQTSLDQRVPWTDNAAIGFTTQTANTTARKGVNLSSLTPLTTPTALLDGTLGANTNRDGVIGSLVRCKLTTTGTYAATTTIEVECTSDNLTAAPAGVHE